MSTKPISSVENLSRPGQPIAANDTYREYYTDNTFRDFIASSGGGAPVYRPIRVIATKAFYRRMTQAERTTLRGTADENINDLREDLQRAPTVNLDDPELLSMLQATPLSGARITELLADGTEDERFVNVATGQ